MDGKAVLLILAAVLQISLQATEDEIEFYKAAVVEFSPNPLQEQNIVDYKWFISQARQEGVDIIVFPEKTVYGLPRGLEGKLSEVPEPEEKVIPCKNGDYKNYEVLEKLSCAAQESSMYVVINLLEKFPCNESVPNCPKEGRFVYNTNIVFNRQGAVISRYRKFNLNEDYIAMPPNQPEFEIFETDFGVKFGVFTSFDILFKTPSYDLVHKYNITNFVHPSFWYGELPFLTGIQILSGWSYAMNVNLLAAGASKPFSGSAGSGIFIGKLGPPISSMADKESSTALICKVPKHLRTLKPHSNGIYIPSMITLEKKEKNAPRTRLQLKQDSTLSGFQSIILQDHLYSNNKEVCSGTLCCKFTLRYTKNRDAKHKAYVYRAVAYQGVKPFSKNATGWVELCAVILCVGSEITDCGVQPDPSGDYHLNFEGLKIEATFSNNETFQMPNILLGKGALSRRTKLMVMGSSHYDFVTHEEKHTRYVKMSLNDESRSIITFGIYSRRFSQVIVSGATSVHHIFFYIMPIVFFVRYF